VVTVAAVAPGVVAVDAMGAGAEGVGAAPAPNAANMPATSTICFSNAATFSVWTEFTVVTVRGGGLPRGMPLVARMLA
jgi:hypothetical protein